LYPCTTFGGGFSELSLALTHSPSERLTRNESDYTDSTRIQSELD